MRVDLYVHWDDRDVINAKLDRILEVQQKQGQKMSQAFDALKVEVDELKVSSDLAIAKIAELKALLEQMGNAPSEADIAAVTAKVNEIEDALEGAGSNPPPPQP